MGVGLHADAHPILIERGYDTDMKATIYHHTKGFPFIPTIIALLDYTKHARVEAQNDEFGAVIKLPTTLDTRKPECKLIELEVKNGKAVKALYRQPLDNERDLCMAIIPRATGAAIVKTVWTLPKGKVPGYNKGVEYAEGNA